MVPLDIPSHHEAAVYDEPGKISTKLETVETPRPNVGEVLVRLTHSGVCASDMAVMTMGWKHLVRPTPKGQVGGHEGVGVVVALGSDADSPGLEVGQRVGIKWLASVCGNCEACLSGADSCCTAKKISGYHVPGTFQQYALAPAQYVTPIPDGLASEQAAPLLCGGLTVYSALRKSGAHPGDWVVVPGAGGGLGHLCVQIGRAMGFRMIGIDSGTKKSLVKDECGAEGFVDLGDYNNNDGDDGGATKMIEDVKLMTGGPGAKAVIVCAASNAAYAQGLRMLKFRGTLVCVGVPEGERVPIESADPGSIAGRELRIVGSAVGTRKDAIDVMELASRGIVKTHVEIFGMEQLTTVFQKMHAQQLQGRAVISLEG
ncbi:hypothetical protein H2204_003142 [Knufia peltigerae]|uniref:Enoyl reductase (ER) domain-containing protein n=1 Tax=Knufia peltigerae TaxID=1002370 RepID=A0AA38YA12_9EURO|nr:hypothetical protein H2204_003142 [Knufia peltigerae]